MSNWKDTIVELFNIETYENENNRLAASMNELARENMDLKKSIQHEKAVSKAMADDFVNMEMELNLLKADHEQYIEMEVERRTLAYEKQHEDVMRHKWYSIGRTDAYAEMGIRALESRKAGTTMYYIKDTGEVIEDITNCLEDVPVEFQKEFETALTDEIEMEDLA